MAMCGYRTGVITDASRSNWQNDAERPIAWSAWYPTDDAACDQPHTGHVFDLGGVTRDATLIAKRKLPVVLLSHGTGGTAESMGWLARSLACKGHVVIGANHHGNTGLEPYLPEGFLCWWERAADLSVLLTSLGQTGFFADRLDDSRASAIGFSLGGHTVMALAGGRTSLDEFDASRSAGGIAERGPKEFPDASDNIPALLENSQAFRQSWALHGDDFTDTLIRSVVAIAPAPPVRSFVPQSIARLEIPVTILTGSADHEAPSAHCADWLVAQNNGFQSHDLGRDVGHYTFLEHPSDTSLAGKVDIFSDRDSVDRTKVHQKAAELVLKTLG